MEIRERPVLFKTHLVERILEGAKTQTRRPVRAGVPLITTDDRVAVTDQVGPLGRPGDRLWVRETWQALVLNSNYRDWVNRGDALLDYDEWWEPVETAALEEQRQHNKTFSVVYRAGADRMTLMEMGEIGWRPSLHMYRWACRLVLEVTDVRVERLPEMSDADLAAEGYPATAAGLEQFAQSWDAAYAKKGAGWADEPWVWAATFKVVEKPPSREDLAMSEEDKERVTEEFRAAVKKHLKKDA